MPRDGDGVHRVTAQRHRLAFLEDEVTLRRTFHLRDAVPGGRRHADAERWKSLLQRRRTSEVVLVLVRDQQVADAAGIEAERLETLHVVAAACDGARRA